MTAIWSLPHPFGRMVFVQRALTAPVDEAEQALAASLPGSVSTLRRASFLAGRRALQEAARHFQLEAASFPSTPRGAPALPAGFTGSLSHKRLGAGPQASVLAVALVAEVNPAFQTVGVDVECKTPARPDIGGRILTEFEQKGLLGGEQDWPLVLASFSLKESIYKAVDPILQRYAGFLEAELTGTPRSWPTEGGHFVNARLSPRGDEPEFELETFLQAVPDRAELVLSAARARARAPRAH